MAEDKKPDLYGGMTFGQRVQAVVSQMSVPKDKNNQFGGYNFRNAEMIYQQAKPHLLKNGLFLSVEDSIHKETVNGKDKLFCKATAYLIDLDSEQRTPDGLGYAELQESKKGMDQGQLTGATSSYARKYALQALFLIDENKDLDHPDLHVNNPAQRDERPVQQQRQQPAPWPELSEMDFGAQTQEIQMRCSQFKSHKWANLNQLANGYKKLVTYINMAPEELRATYLPPLEKVKDTLKARLSAQNKGN